MIDLHILANQQIPDSQSGVLPEFSYLCVSFPYKVAKMGNVFLLTGIQ